MSACYGAMLLADAGLLDGIDITSRHWGIEGLKNAAPTRVVGTRVNATVVDSGKIIATAGVTAGSDGAQHVIERLLGIEAVRWTADEWSERKGR